jgi:Protein of unknown function (DUF3300)
MAHRGLRCLYRLAGLVALWAAITAPVQAQQSGTAPLTKAQLEQLVAPIALHPDPLLSQMLMASTYPTEVVQAARWLRENSGLTGQPLQDAVQKQPWESSVRALTSAPQALEMMSDKLDWTQQLGDAFLAQQEELLAAVQRLRQRAEANGHLKTSDEQKVSVVTPPEGGTTPIITIEPASPEHVYVPVYDPRVVYGDWPHPDYEPFHWSPAGFTGRGILSFATGAAVGSANWGRLDWRRGRVDIDVNRYNQFNHTRIADTAWRHDPRHRGNVPYRDANVAQKFGDAKRAAAREAYRGKPEAGRRDLAKAPVAKPDGGTKAKSARESLPQLAEVLAVMGKPNPPPRQKLHPRSKPQRARLRRARSNPPSRRLKARQRAQNSHPPAEPRGHAATRGPQHGYRPAGGGQRMSTRGGGPRHGGGGRRGGRR